MQFDPIIPSLIDNDLYKFSMGQAILHQFPGYKTRWAFECRDKDVHFTHEMVEEIREQIKHYCSLTYKKDELDYLRSLLWIKGDYVDQLRIWHPVYDDFYISEDAECGLAIETDGPWFSVSPYETPTLAIVSEVYYKMAYNYSELIEDFKKRLDIKFELLRSGKYYLKKFSDFGFRRRLSFEAQDVMIRKFVHLNDTLHCPTQFVGTSDVYFAYKHGTRPTGTKAHEWTMCVGQGNPKHSLEYSNWYDLNAWFKEYGTLNGIALADTLGTDVFLKDFQLTFAKIFDGVRQDSGDPIAWGEKLVDHYKKLGIDPLTKTLMFSDSLNFEKADAIADHFRDKADFAFGIGTFLTNDTFAPAPNFVMKPIECNGRPIAKLSDAPGKCMCRDASYIEHLRRCVQWRLDHE